MPCICSGLTLRGRLPDCLIAPANISAAVRCCPFACTWQVWASRSLSRKRSKPKRSPVELCWSSCCRSARLLLRKNRAVIVSFSSLHHTCGKRSGWKHNAVAPRMHVTGESFAIRVAYAIGPKRKGRMSALDQPAFFRDIMRQRKKRKSAFELCTIGTWCLFCCRSYKLSARVESTCCAFMPQLLSVLSRLCTVLLLSVAPRIRVTGGSFAIRVSFSIKPKRKNGRKDCSLPIWPPSLRKIRDCSIFLFLSFFFFLATKSQVGCRQREKLVANGD